MDQPQSARGRAEMTPDEERRALLNEDFHRRKRQYLRNLFLLLGSSLVTSAIAAVVLLGADRIGSARGVVGAVLTLVALGPAAGAVVCAHRFPDPTVRKLYPPGQLGSARVGTWLLAAVCQGPAFLALTVVLDRN